MRKITLPLLAMGLLMISCSGTKKATMENNMLSKSEADEGWQLLFDGKSTNGWHKFNTNTIGSAWKAEDGVLHLDASQKQEWQIKDGGDIVTDEEFENFHLKLEWKISQNGNSGIMIYAKEGTDYKWPWETAPEMQVLDNAGHADSKIIKHRAGDLYDLISASPETVKPHGEWNQVEIISKNGQLEFHLNGTRVVATTLWNDSWKAMVAGSKFKDMPGFGKFKKGRIGLQDHGDHVWYRNIKIRKL